MIRPPGTSSGESCGVLQRALQGAVAEDEVAGLLADHDRGRVGVGGRSSSPPPRPRPRASRRSATGSALYVTDLYGLDLGGGTFGASFWVWGVGQDAGRALRSMEFANADRVAASLESTVPRGSVAWSQRKVTGTFRQDWDLRNFPFDRHSLEIPARGGRAGGGRPRLRGG